MQLLQTSAPEPHPDAAWRRLLRAIRLGALTLAGGAIGVWLIDAAMLLPDRRTAGTGRWLTGLGVALLVAVSTALVLGGVLGPVGVPLTRSVASRLRALAARLRDPDRDTQLQLSASAFTVMLLAVLTSVVTNRLAFVVVLDVARPESMALIIAGMHLAVVTLLVALWPVLIGLIRGMVGQVGSLPGLRWLTARAVRLLGFFFLGALVVAGWMFHARWRELRQLPWHLLLPIPGWIGGTVLAWRAGQATSASIRRGAWALVTVCVVLGLVAGRRVHPESTEARRIAFERTLSGEVGWTVWTAALDFDHDGQLSVLGGGDCGPFDPLVHVGAIDVPDDGIDQDCDGIDASNELLHSRGRVFLPLSATATHADIILITVDGLAANRLVAIGHGASLMPNVDHLAATSAFFVHAFSEGPSTRLSFPSMFTSHYDSELSFTFASRPPYPLAPTEKQIQDMLDASGYETTAVVSHRYFTPAAWPSVTRGFQRIDTSPVDAGKNNSQQVTNAALRALNAPHDRPLYLWVHYYDAHSPYVAPPDFPPANPSDSAIYDSELRLVDREVGRLLDAITARPTPTYVVLTADHGTVFHPRPWTRHGRYGYDLYSATLHVPLMFHGPGIHVRQIEGLASTMDLAPTLADIVHGGDRMEFRGVSLAPEIFQNADDRSRMLFSEFYLGERDYRGEDPLVMLSLRTDQWNFVLDRVHGTYELYDWTRDYFEENDRFEDDAHLPKVMRFRALLSAFLQRYHRRPPGSAILPTPVPGRI